MEAAGAGPDPGPSGGPPFEMMTLVSVSLPHPPHRPFDELFTASHSLQYLACSTGMLTKLGSFRSMHTLRMEHLDGWEDKDSTISGGMFYAPRSCRTDSRFSTSRASSSRLGIALAEVSWRLFISAMTWVLPSLLAR